MGRVLESLRRARREIIGVALVYAVSVSVGVVQAHRGDAVALRFRDALVARAQQSDPSSIAAREGRHVRAALIDFGRNFLAGAVPETVLGLTIVSPFGIAGYRGWVGGIVSVNRRHQSRLTEWRRAAYYAITLVLQLIPYSIAGGVGVRLGLTAFRDDAEYRGERRWLGYPAGALRDALYAYAPIAPLFLVASLWEFLSTWNGP
jgi:hypothetical protein